MVKPISIIHFTDIHVKQSNEQDVKRRVTDFIKHANEKKLSPDLMLISGDLTYNGLSDEYEIFDRVFLKPICAALHIGVKQLVIVPGNHDVDRNLVSAPELSIRNKLTSSRDAQDKITSKRSKRLTDFYAYVDNLGVLKDSVQIVAGNASVQLMKIRGIQIGVASLNTAWECADDNDKGKLLLTEIQIANALERVAHCDFKLAVCHHPEDWLHPNERDLALQDLKRGFDVVMCGHLHDPVSHYHLEPGAEHIWLVGRAFFDGKVSAEVEDGFHFYEVDVPAKKLTAKYRKYIRKRGAYVEDTSHSDGGEFEFSIPSSKKIFASETIVVQRLADQGTSLHQEIKKELSLLQDTQNPIVVTPKLCRIRFDKGERKRSRTGTLIAEILKESAFICGPADSGKSILLKGIAAEHQLEVSERALISAEDSNPTLYFKFPRQPNVRSVSDLEVLVLKELSETKLENHENIRLRLLVDDLKKDVADSASLVHELCSKNKWTYIIAVGNDIAGDALAQSPLFQNTAFYEIQPWGPSKIKEMAVRLFENTGVDAELAFKCVKRTLADYDLPANPTTVSLYFSLVAKSGGSITGVSFLRLLERIEQNRIGVDEKPPANDIYHRRQLLYRFALRMMESSTDSIDLDEVKQICATYFSQRMLGNFSGDLLLSLERSGIVVIENDKLTFVNFVFLNYYIARGIADGVISEDSISSDLTQCVCLAQSLALFAGMKRENIALAEKVLKWIEQRFPEPESRNLSDLDQHVNSLLEAAYEEGEADGIVERDLAEKEDHSKDDENYESGRSSTAENRKALFSKKSSLTLDELSAHTASLYAFYGVLKNLEGINGDRKVVFLNRILDFHIRTNFFLIDYFHSLIPDEDFRTVAAYMMTWSGHKFMAASLGTQALCEAAKECIRTGENDFKELLLMLLLSDLRDHDALKLLESFVQKTNSRAAMEIIFIHLRQRMIEHEAATIPTELVSVFRTAFIRRQRSYSKKADKQKDSNLFDKILRDAKRQHSLVRKSGINT